MTRRSAVALVAVLVVAAFALAAFVYNRLGDRREAPAVATAYDSFVRPYAPVLGPKNAPVTIVEFFDPACEACRAFYPVVKQIMAAFPNEVRLVLRYAAFHKGSDEAVRILEAARLQGKFEQVLEALLAAQPSWAAHGAPQLSKAWDAAEASGLDVAKARQQIMLPDITAVLNGDTADVQAIGVRQTPTFFVNRKPLSSFGAQQLYDLVNAEVETSRGTTRR